METLTWFWNVFWNVFKVAFGLGFVIFIHELGHFVLAKWNGVKVEKFSIGFGPTLLGFKYGETDYVLAAVPLGGFVKMLGEGPEEDTARTTDPRAYNNKTVGARMAIISAGVIMNVILGLGCFVYAYGQGMVDRPAMVGGIEPASPAYEAGLRAGDEIISIDGRGELSWNSMTLKVILSREGQTLHFGVKRPGHENLLALDIQPVRAAGSDRPTIGVHSSSSLNVAFVLPPAGMASPPEFPRPEETKGPLPLQTLVAVGLPDQPPIPVSDSIQYRQLLARHGGQPLVHYFEKREGTLDAPGKTLDRFELTFPPASMIDFGFRLSIEPITGIQKDSPADRAGFRKGDRIVRVNGRDDFDPLRLPSLCYENAGKPMTFEVRRAAADGSETIQTITATPDASPPWTDPPQNSDAVAVSGLGLCYPVLTHIAAVNPDSPAARAGLKPGDVINSITFTPKPIPEADKSAAARPPAAPVRPETVSFDDASRGWVRAFWKLQEGGYESVSLVVNKGSRPVEIQPQPDPTWYYPSRGLLLLPQFRMLPPQSIGAALSRGWDDTIENIIGIYGTIRGLVLGRLGPKGVAGPITIVQVAYDTARSGLTDLIHFLGILSINLAVINFLPIPPLDGGQMLFLVAEKVRGRPLPDSALSAGILVGIVLVVALMIFVLFQDVFRLVERWNGF